MMVRRVVLLLCCLLFVLVGSVSAAGDRANDTYAISGTVYLQGQSDRSSTTVSINATVVPSLGVWGIAAALLLMMLVLLCRKKRKPALAVLFIGVGGVQSEWSGLGCPGSGHRR